MNLARLPLVSFILRIGVAFAFLYPAIDAIFDPESWIGYFPAFAHMLIPNDVILLYAFGLVEALLALWLLSGRRAHIPALIMTVMLVAITLLNLSSFDVVFRDLSIAAASLALAVLYWPPRRTLI